LNPTNSNFVQKCYINSYPSLKIDLPIKYALIISIYPNIIQLFNMLTRKTTSSSFPFFLSLFSTTYNFIVAIMEFHCNNVLMHKILLGSNESLNHLVYQGSTQKMIISNDWYFSWMQFILAINMFFITIFPFSFSDFSMFPSPRLVLNYFYHFS
jgi:hypothetical protein